MVWPLSSSNPPFPTSPHPYIIAKSGAIDRSVQDIAGGWGWGGGITSYTRQSGKLKSYFHCTIKTCKDGGKVAMESSGEHLASAALAALPAPWEEGAGKGWAQGRGLGSHSESRARWSLGHAEQKALWPNIRPAPHTLAQT